MAGTLNVVNDVGVSKGVGGGGEKPAVISPTPVAVVVDTNLWGKGTLDAGRLKTLADRLVGSRIEVWVPTQVLWEWASHAVSDAELATPVWNRLKRAWLVKGPIPVSSVATVVLEALEKTLASIPNVIIVPMTGAAAIAGIQDQVLGTGPGALRSGVKTGAVDSSLVRDAIAHAGGDASKVVFVTNNAKDVHDTAKAIGATVHVRPEDALYASLFPAVAEPEYLLGLIVEELEEKASPDTEDHPAYMQESLLPVSDIQVSKAAFDPPEYFELTDTALAYGGSIVAIVDVDVVDGLVQGLSAGGPTTEEGGAGSHRPSWTVAFTAVLLADVDAVGYQLDNDGQVSPSAGVIVDTVIFAPMVADLVDRSVQSLTANGSARAEKADPGFLDSEDALAWVLTELGALHGVRLENDDISLTEFTFRGPKDVTLVATRTGLEAWKLTFDLGDAAADAVITCHYDPDARVWAGRNSFHARGLFSVFSGEDGGATRTNAYYVMSDVWRHLNGL